jgi:hypothetical protein
MEEHRWNYNLFLFGFDAETVSRKTGVIPRATGEKLWLRKKKLHSFDKTAFGPKFFTSPSTSSRIFVLPQIRDQEFVAKKLLGLLECKIFFRVVFWDSKYVKLIKW